MKKPSLLDRLTGMHGNDSEYDDFFEDEDENESFDKPISAHIGAPESPSVPPVPPTAHNGNLDWKDEMANEGELAVDVYETPEYVVVKALVAGVMPNNVDISVSREMLTIEGTREDEHEVDEDGYFQRELYWGAFSRTILLPAEVDVDMAEAVEKHGILVIRLPKINKSKQTKLKVRSR